MPDLRGIEKVIVLAGVGMLAIVGGGAYGVWYLVKHLHWVP